LQDKDILYMHDAIETFAKRIGELLEQAMSWGAMTVVDGLTVV